MRAQLAVTSAREQLRRDGEDLLSDARVLADRPALPRLLEDAAATAASSHSCTASAETTNVDVAALLQGDGALAQSGPPRGLGARSPPRCRSRASASWSRPRDGGPMIWGAAAPVPGTDGARGDAAG